MARCCVLLAGIILCAVGGCIVIPTSEHSLLEGRGKIEESDIAFIETGETTRADVVLQFGEPDLVMHDQHILVYHWQVSHGYWLAGAGYYGDAGSIPKDYLLMLEFDEEGRLKRFERSGSIWMNIFIFKNTQTRLEDWITPGSEKVPKLVKEAEGQGVSRVYNSAYKAVFDATLAAAKTKELRIMESDKNSGRIILSHGVTWWSWGERIAVFLNAVTPETTEVEIVSKPILSPLNFPPDWQQILLEEIDVELQAK